MEGTMTATDEHARHIRERALRLWQEAGSPPGGTGEYLERARELQAFEDHPAAALLPNPMTLHHGAIEPEQPVEEAEIMENLGEFPGRLTDQGDRSPVPMTRRRARRLLQQE
jgi:hypothetical protein